MAVETYYGYVRKLFSCLSFIAPIVAIAPLQAGQDYQLHVDALCEQLARQNEVLGSIVDAASAEQGRLDYLAITGHLRELKGAIDDEVKFAQFISNDELLNAKVTALIIDQCGELQRIEHAGCYENEPLALLLFGERKQGASQD